MKSLDPLYPQIGSTHDDPGPIKDLDPKGDNNRPQPGVFFMNLFRFYNLTRQETGNTQVKTENRERLITTTAFNQ